MLKWFFFLISVLCSGLQAQAGETTIDGRLFRLPDGYTIEKVAGPPLTDRPIVADFDDQGRLYVADSSGSNAKVADQLKNPTHRIVRLEDTDGDGKFDKSVVFADKMMFPEGAMWLDGSFYVAAPPSIWKLTDTDNDGVADVREEWFQGKTLTGCANDLHGPYAGPDGWIYWAKGAFAEQTYERPGRKPLVTKAAHIFRCKPDGTSIEQVMTGGMDNPVEVAFSASGDRFFNTTFLINPTDGKRDGVIHAVLGGVWGKIHGVIDNHPRTQPEMMPVLSHLGAAAPSGLMRLESTAWNEPTVDTLFTSCFNMRKIVRHRLTPKGAGYVSEDLDFLVSTEQDFHPTDVLEDADGSLLVVDTGGWYKLCCPTSQIEKADVLGAIYRVRKTDVPKIDDPRGLKLAWTNLSTAELQKRLNTAAKPAVQLRAMRELAKRGDAALLRPNAQDGSELNAKLARLATRVATPAAQEILKEIVARVEFDPTTKKVALEGLILLNLPDFLSTFENALASIDPHITRRGAEGLARIRDPRSIAPVVAKLKSISPDDPTLLHSLTFALLEIGDSKELLKQLATAEGHVRRALLIALDQSGGSIKAEHIIPEISSSDPRALEIAAWIVGRHPEWGNEVAGPLKTRLAQVNSVDSSLAGMLAKTAKDSSIQAVLADSVKDPKSSLNTKLTALSAMSEAGLKPVPTIWIEAIAASISDNRSQLVASMVQTLRSWNLTSDQATPIIPALLSAAKTWAPAQVSADALAAIPKRSSQVDSELFHVVLTFLNDENPVALRLAASDAFGKLSLSVDQLAKLAEAIKKVGPLELPRLLTAFDTSSDETLGLALISALKSSPGKSVLRADMLTPVLTKFGPKVQAEAKKLVEEMDVDLSGRKAKLEELTAKMEKSPGDMRRGQAIFGGAKAACLTCHQMGYVGGRVGPDLSRIGQIRSEADLLESIVYPSSSFVRSYEPMLVSTKAGIVYNGIVRDDGRDQLQVATNATEVVKIARDEVDSMRPGSVSVMPAGLDQQLTTQDLADLIAFLKSRK